MLLIEVTPANFRYGIVGSWVDHYRQTIDLIGQTPGLRLLPYEIATAWRAFLINVVLTRKPHKLAKRPQEDRGIEWLALPLVGQGDAVAYILAGVFPAREGKPLLPDEVVLLRDIATTRPFKQI